jgi:hypothetical protein
LPQFRATLKDGIGTHFIHARGRGPNPRPIVLTHGTRSPIRDAIAGFQRKKGAYAIVQGSQPQVAAIGLNDSPAGLATWIVEKFRRWSDCGGDVERVHERRAVDERDALLGDGNDQLVHTSRRPRRSSATCANPSEESGALPRAEFAALSRRLTRNEPRH